MAIVIPDGGEAIALEYLVNKDVPEDLILRLFKNNVVPAEADAVGDYTEATFTGYAQKSLAGASWTTTPGAPSKVAFAEQTFASTANQAAEDIYGYYYVRTTGGELVGAERFTNAPFAIQNNGDEIRVTPEITAD